MPSIINRRGRPPHPNILTPSEWQVLEGVHAGLTNQEIADRLGVTFHTVKAPCKDSRARSRRWSRGR